MAKASRKNPKTRTLLRDAMKAKGLTQVQFGKLIGKPQPYVCNLLKGRFSPSLAVALRIQGVLDVEMTALV